VPWGVERRADGFAAVVDLPGSQVDRDAKGHSEVIDEFIIDVTVDDAAGTFVMNPGRARSANRDRETKSVGRYIAASTSALMPEAAVPGGSSARPTVSCRH